MIFIGVNLAIDAEKEVVFAASVSEAANAPAGSLVVLDFREEDLGFYSEAEIPLAVRVKSVREFVLLAATSAKYAIAEIELAKELQKIAEHYLFDLKHLAIAPVDAIETVAKLGIDGIFAKRFPV